LNPYSRFSFYRPEPTPTPGTEETEPGRHPNPPDLIFLSRPFPHPLHSRRPAAPCSSPAARPHSVLSSAPPAYPLRRAPPFPLRLAARPHPHRRAALTYPSSPVPRPTPSTPAHLPHNRAAPSPTPLPRGAAPSFPQDPNSSPLRRCLRGPPSDPRAASQTGVRE
jgi:hypothetical protein